MVRKVKSTKAGFVGSDSNISPEATLEDVIALRTKTGHSTMAVTDNGQADGKLVGIVTSALSRLSFVLLPCTAEEREEYIFRTCLNICCACASFSPRKLAIYKLILKLGSFFLVPIKHFPYLHIALEESELRLSLLFYGA